MMFSNIDIPLQEDQDSMETDLDKSEMVKPQTGELSGDRLLNTHYVSTGATNKRRKVNQNKLFSTVE